MDVMSVMSRSWWPGSGPDHHYNKTNVMNRNRGFARSDDGGHTWGEVWYLSARPGDRQPRIGTHDTFSPHLQRRRINHVLGAPTERDPLALELHAALLARRRRLLGT